MELYLWADEIWDQAMLRMSTVTEFKNTELNNRNAQFLKEQTRGVMKHNVGCLLTAFNNVNRVT